MGIHILLIFSNLLVGFNGWPMCVYSHFSLPHTNIGLNIDIFSNELNHGAWGGHFHFITNDVQKN